MSAKQGLLKWLGAFVAFDIVVLGAVLASQLLGTPIELARVTGALSTFLAPPVLLLLNNIIPRGWKNSLVFWRLRDVLPAHRAFSEHAERDTRVSISKLRNRLGEFPIPPRDQQDVWFGLYQAHKTDAAVLDSHRLHLIFRDLAAVSFFLALLVPLVLWIFGSGVASWSTLVVFGCQYLLAALASHQSGVRLVCTVLSLESHSMVPAAMKENKSEVK